MSRAEQPTNDPGSYRGRHFSSFVPEVERLKREGDLQGAERLLVTLIETTEAEDEATEAGVRPWYYEKLAVIYRERKDYASELAVLERFSRHRQAPGATPRLLLERLEKVRALVERGRTAGSEGVTGTE